MAFEKVSGIDEQEDREVFRFNKDGVELEFRFEEASREQEGQYGLMRIIKVEGLHDGKKYVFFAGKILLDRFNKANFQPGDLGKVVRGSGISKSGPFKGKSYATYDVYIDRQGGKAVSDNEPTGNVVDLDQTNLDDIPF